MRFTALALAIFVAGCRGSSFTPSASNGMQRASELDPFTSQYHYAVVYSFKGGSDAAYPFGGLISFRRKLYGVASSGGRGFGTVYVVNPSGREHVIYSFKGGSDGRSPSGNLVVLNGLLYGTTMEGGSGTGCSHYPYGCGTVFAVTPSGTEHVVYNFNGEPDGAEPNGSLVALNGVLYGTTFQGGTNAQCSLSYTVGCGVIFSVTPSGNERVLHRFKGIPDGISPSAGLIVVGDTLYGTTFGGGIKGCDYHFPQEGCGTVYKITITGRERIIYRFNGDVNGDEPVAGLTLVNRTLFGTTTSGGAACRFSSGCGTIFSLKARQFTLRYAFKDNPDGATPQAPLTFYRGHLYGTTTGGGFDSGCNGQSNPGCGIVFAYDATSGEKVLHQFTGPDGAFPEAGLTVLNDVLYGTTADGGRSGMGVVYRISP